MNISAYGLYPIAVTESPYGERLYSAESIRAAILAIPDDERDAWYLPDFESNWAYWGGAKINYQFTDEYGDRWPAFYCGECAERRIIEQATPRPYVASTIYSSEDTDLCDDCGTEVSN